MTSICPDLWEARPRGLCGTEGSSGLSSAGGEKPLAPGTWLWAGAASLPPGGPQWLSEVGVCPGTLSHACPLPDSGSCLLQQSREVGKRDGPATTLIFKIGCQSRHFRDKFLYKTGGVDQWRGVVCGGGLE